MLVHATRECFDYSAHRGRDLGKKAVDFRLRGLRETAPTTSLTVDIELQFFPGCIPVHNMCAGYSESDLGCLVKGFVKIL